MISPFKSLIAIVLTSHIGLSFAETAPTIDLTDAVKNIKQQLPQELSADMLLTDVNYDLKKQTLIYSATALDTEADQINSDRIINQTCYNPMLRDAINKGITVSFFYYAINKELIKHVVITEALCESNFKEFEGLLIKDIAELKANTLPESISNQLTLFNLSYEPAQKRLTVDIKAANDQVDLTHLEKEYSINLACKHNYFSVLVERNLDFTFNYFNPQGTQLIKSFFVSAKDCDPNTSKKLSDAEKLDEKLAHDAAVMKKNLKALSTEQIELIDVSYDPTKRIIWNKAVIKDPSITMDKINPQLNIASVCTTPSTRQTIVKGVSYHYSYYDFNKKLLTSFLIDNNVCKQFDQRNNLLLQH